MIYNLSQKNKDTYILNEIKDENIVSSEINYTDYFYIEKSKDTKAQLENAKNNGIVKEYSDFSYKNRDFYKVFLNYPIMGKPTTPEENKMSADTRKFVYGLAKKYKMYEYDVYPEIIKVIYENHITFLKENLNYTDIPYCVFDIEVQGEKKAFPTPERNFIFYIGAKGINIHGKEVEFYKSVSDYTENQDEYGTIGEKQMLIDFLAFLTENKFVILSGYNIYNFDLYFIAERLKHHNIPFNVGNDTIYQVESSRPDKTFRHPLVKFQNPYYKKFVSKQGTIVFFDIFYYTFRTPAERGEIKYKYGSVSLKNVSDYYGVLKKKERVIIEGVDIYNEFLKNPKYMKQYLIDDVESTNELYKKFAPIMLYLANYANEELSNIFDSSQTQILERALYKKIKEKGHLIFPKSNEEYSLTESENYHGGNSKIHAKGYYKNVVKLDFTSLYPSIMLDWKIKPEKDEEQAFYNTVYGLYTERLKYKEQSKKYAKSDSEEDKELYTKYSNYSAALKILINSAYGLLGYRQRNSNKPASRFSDIKQAALVTEIGRNLITSVEDLLLKRGFTIIETDTDGIMFTDTTKTTTDEVKEEAIAFTKEINDGFRTLGKQYLNLDYESVKTGMISIKIKNYILFDKDKNKIDITPHGSTIINFTKPNIVKKTISDFLDYIITAPSLEDVFKKFSFLYIASPLEKNPHDFLAYCKNFKKEDFYYNFSSKETESYKSTEEDIAQKILVKKYINYYGVKPLSDTQIQYYITSSGTKMRDRVELAENFDWANLDYREYLKEIKKTIITLILNIYDTNFITGTNVKYDIEKNKIDIKATTTNNPYSDDEIFNKKWYNNVFTTLTDKVKNQVLTTIYNHQVIGENGSFFRPLLKKLIYPPTKEYEEYLEKYLKDKKNANRIELLKSYYYSKKYNDLADNSQEKLAIKMELNDDELYLFDTKLFEKYVPLETQTASQVVI
ncbi:MAG: DNA polymerase domain-containing protein [Candidatus Micrarchaeaceae archaeon]